MRSTKKKLYGLIFFVIGIVVVFHYIGWLAPIETFFRQLVIPGSDVVYQISVNVGKKEERFSNPEELQNAYESLKELYISNLVDEAELVLLRDENSELRNQLNFLQVNKFDSVGALVVAKDIDPSRSTILINRGQDSGIAVGQPAIIGKGAIIGKVVKVGPKSATIQLLNDHQSRLATTLTNEDKSIGLVEGGYGISIRMNFIPQNEQIRVGDVVVTSGLEELIPLGLVVGTVDAVEKEAYQPFQSAIVSPAASLDKLRHVSVLKTVIRL